jgi:hypothetical protein
MICVHLYNQTCTLNYWAPGPPDEHNNQTDTWTSVTTLCSMQQRARLEGGGDAELGVGIWGVWLKPNVQVPGPVDQIVLGGETFHFHGYGWPAYDYNGNLDHIEATAWRAA